MEVYIIRTRVRSLEEKSRAVKAYKPDPNGTEIVTERENMGWFVWFDRSYESLFVGMDKPTNLEPGTEVDIIIRPVT